MGAMEDVFGTNPNRPDHPDFWALAEVVLALDASSEGGSEQAIEDAINSVPIDEYSLFYVAMQRAHRASMVSPMAAPAVWVDGFLAAVLFLRRHRG